jgi:hypothetical protein
MITGRAILALDQLFLQREPIHVGHPDIGDDAAAIAQQRRCQQRLAIEFLYA